MKKVEMNTSVSSNSRKFWICHSCSTWTYYGEWVPLLCWRMCYNCHKIKYGSSSTSTCREYPHIDLEDYLPPNRLPVFILVPNGAQSPPQSSRATSPESSSSPQTSRPSNYLEMAWGSSLMSMWDEEEDDETDSDDAETP